MALEKFLNKFCLIIVTAKELEKSLKKEGDYAPSVNYLEAITVSPSDQIM